MKDVSSTH